jgi:uncharacterized protein YbjT (DUF2867 family)
MIALLGATGTVGSLIVERLTEPATLVTRDPAKLTAATIKGHRVTQADITDPTSLRSAFANADTVICISSDSAEQSKHEIAAMRAAEAAGVKRFVKLSAQSAAMSPPVSFGREHAVTEQALASSSMETVSVRPVFFAQSLLFFADSVKTGKLIYPAGKGAVAFVDARDIADVMVRAATDPTINGPLTLTGPEAFTFRQVADKLGAALTRKVRHISPPGFVARKALPKLAGVSPWQAGMIVELAQAQKAGGQSTISGDVQRILNRAPRTLDNFLTDHLAAFR